MNSKNRLSKTIAAITTGTGGAIAIIRLSGSESLSILKKIFYTKTKTIKPRFMYYGNIISKGKVIEKCLAVYFKGPNSFTGEDSVEFHIHGGFLNAKRILNLIFDNGAFQAEAGEFSERAFLHGKIDLVQAEAIQSLIDSRAEFSLEQSINQLNGDLSKNISNINKNLIEVNSIVQASIDFPEEDYDFLEKYNVVEKITNILDELKFLSSSYSHGKLVHNGALIVIIGEPNVGKSSLMNRLLMQDRAIVTDIPGTTRDYLEAELTINGMLIRLMDTAGIRKSSNKIEQMGIEKVYSKIEESDLILFLVDENGFKNKEVYNKFKDKKHIIIQNKSDKKIISEVELNISVKDNKNIEELKNIIYKRLLGSDFEASKIMITNNRHKIHIDNAIKNLENSLNACDNYLPLEFIAQDLKFALNEISSILGDVTPDDILGNIFGKFCIGK